LGILDWGTGAIHDSVAALHSGRNERTLMRTAFSLSWRAGIDVHASPAVQLREEAVVEQLLAEPLGWIITGRVLI
jgi:hypothetical protein